MEHENDTSGDVHAAHHRQVPPEGHHFVGEPVTAWAVGAGESAFASVARASLLRDYARWGIGPVAGPSDTDPVTEPPGSAA